MIAPAFSQPPVAIVGSGAVAQALGRLLHTRGAPVVALASRNPASAERAATFVGPSVRAVPCAEIPRLATRVLIAISDDGIASVAEALARAGMRSGVALHTCGARGPEALAALQANGVACGVLHPLQTIVDGEQGVARLQGISFGLSGDRLALEWAEEIVALLGGQSLHPGPGQLGAYHAGAVLASNGIVAILDAAVILMAGAGIEPEAALRAVAPLARTSLENVLSRGPEAALTGPIVRGDTGTVATHTETLANAPATVAALYRAVGRRLLELARKRGLPEARTRAIESLLEE